MDDRPISISGKLNIVQQLKGFCYAAVTGSITKAAERMSLTQPSVSLQIRALERELGSVLFERRGRVKLTAEGKMLLDLARPLIEQIEALPKTFAELRRTPNRGELNIGAAESTLLYLLPSFVKRFSNNYPEIRFRLHNVTGLDGLAMLRADEFELGIGSMTEMLDDFSYQPLFTYAKMLISAPEHPLASLAKPRLRDISRYDLILPPRHLHTWRLVKTVFDQNSLDCRVLFEAGGWEVIKKYVEQNLGVSIVTAICLTGKENLHVVPMDRYFPNRTYGVVTRKNRRLSLQARLFVEMLEEEAGKSTTPLRQALKSDAGEPSVTNRKAAYAAPAHAARAVQNGPARRLRSR